MKRIDMSWLTKENLREVLFNDDSPRGKGFNMLLLVMITASIMITFIETEPRLHPIVKTVLEVMEALMMVFFTAEYVGRVWCAENRRGYVLSLFGIIDLLAVLPPYLTIIFPGARYMMLMRTIRFLRIFRILRLFTMINEGYFLIESLKKSRNKITVYFLFVMVMVICLGTLMYMVENGHEGTQFTSLGTSIYWAIVTLTTVGYGDITPVTSLGRLLSAFIMLLGYTIIAVPTGIVSATFVDETNKRVRNNKCPRCGGHVDKGDRYCSHCGEKL